MYLFLPILVILKVAPVYLYIPKCIYFYQDAAGDEVTFWLCFTFQNVSISTMFILGGAGFVVLFTFQNVSISTHPSFLTILQTLCPLHSKMYLFLPYEQVSDYLKEQLYIPKCIYFYLQMVSLNLKNINFTFQNVSISTNLFPSFKACRSVFTFQNVSISTCSRQRLPAVL